jgi:hypothetical protein
MKRKTDYKDLASQNFPYKSHYLGNILFDGKLVRANANFACFMTLNSCNPASCDIPDNVRVCAVTYTNYTFPLHIFSIPIAFISMNILIMKKKLLTFFDDCFQAIRSFIDYKSRLLYSYAV